MWVSSIHTRVGGGPEGCLSGIGQIDDHEAGNGRGTLGSLVDGQGGGCVAHGDHLPELVGLIGAGVDDPNLEIEGALRILHRQLAVLRQGHGGGAHQLEGVRTQVHDLGIVEDLLIEVEILAVHAQVDPLFQILLPGDHHRLLLHIGEPMGHDPLADHKQGIGILENVIFDGL